MAWVVWRWGRGWGGGNVKDGLQENKAQSGTVNCQVNSSTVNVDQQHITLHLHRNELTQYSLLANYINWLSLILFSLINGKGGRSRTGLVSIHIPQFCWSCYPSSEELLQTSCPTGYHEMISPGTSHTLLSSEASRERHRGWIFVAWTRWVDKAGLCIIGMIHFMVSQKGLHLYNLFIWLI